jgi:Asp-tRNA(Asn)/Glu-tRNA(Gln) amidotransferase A subunit family amidase
MRAVDVARNIAAREITSLEVVEASLRRVEETEPSLNAFVQVDVDRALAGARQADRDVANGKPLGPLHGVAVSVKDLIDVKGLRATYGSLSLKDAVAQADSPSVERLRAAGAVIIGETTTSEFGYLGYTRTSCTETPGIRGTWGERRAVRAAARLRRSPPGLARSR